MLTTGPNLGLLDNGGFGERAYAETLHMYRSLDTLVQPRVISMSVMTPPTEPVEGEAYIVPAGATGSWATRGNMIARWTARTAVVEPQWEFHIPRPGWEFSVDDIGVKVRFDGFSWVGCSVVVAASPPDNNDGRPDGTVYFQLTP